MALSTVIFGGIEGLDKGILYPLSVRFISRVLSRMITKLEEEGEIHGLKLGRLALPITHLFFADVILIFCRTEVNQTDKILKCLETFCSWT